MSGTQLTSHLEQRHRAFPRLTAFVVLVVVAVAAMWASPALAGQVVGLMPGAAAVSSCSTSATVTYNTSHSAIVGGAAVTTTPLASPDACARKTYHVTLTGSSDVLLETRTGVLDAAGNAFPDFTSSSISAASVSGIAVVISDSGGGGKRGARST